MRPWRLYLQIALICLILLTGIRLVFFYSNNHELIHHPDLKGLLIGMRFDVCVVSYWLAPLLLMNMLWPASKWAKTRIIAEKTWLYLGVSLIFLAGLADIGWYHYFLTHLNVQALEYGKNPVQAAGMILMTTDFLWLLIGFILLVFMMVPLLRLMLRKNLAKPRTGNRPLALGFCYMAFCFLGMRGGISGKPINVRDNRYCEHAFFNDMAINPLFYLYKQVFEGQRFQQNDGKTAWAQTQEHLKSMTALPAPLIDSGILKNRHVVLILMESMASHKTDSGEHIQTPFLNKLSRKGLHFTQFYANGEHTYNGVFSTLTGYGGLMGRHMLRFAETLTVPGISGMLKSQGYFNIFQIPHRRTFDNMGAFLWRHQFDSVVDYANIPENLRGGNNWGVCDHRLFRYAIRNMDQLTARGKRVFSGILSISDHPPYEIPADAPAALLQGDPKNHIVEYADWSLQNFFDSASRRPWFNETIFILVADHGHYSGRADYPLPLDFHRIPCIMIAPGSELPAMTISGLGSQTDILPILGWLLGADADPNCTGVNLLTHKRTDVTFCSDAWLGITDGRHYHLVDEFGYSRSYELSLGPDQPESAVPPFLRNKLEPLQHTLLNNHTGTEYFIQTHLKGLPE